MAQTNFVKELQDIDTFTYNAIVKQFKLKGITELDIQKKYN